MSCGAPGGLLPFGSGAGNRTQKVRAYEARRADHASPLSMDKIVYLCPFSRRVSRNPISCGNGDVKIRGPNGFPFRTPPLPVRARTRARARVRRAPAAPSNVQPPCPSPAIDGPCLRSVNGFWHNINDLAFLRGESGLSLLPNLRNQARRVDCMDMRHLLPAPQISPVQNRVCRRKPDLGWNAFVAHEPVQHLDSRRRQKV